MKKLVMLLLVLGTLLVSSQFFADPLFDFKPDEGIININYSTSDYTKFKVVITKGEDRYIYNINNKQESFALQLGDGTYTVALYQNISGNKYKKVSSTSKTVNVNEEAVDLASVQNINWDLEMEAIALAEELSESKLSDRERFMEAYNFIIDNIVYDYRKASSISSRYLPVIDTTIEEEKGICYDYSSLLASMMRSLGIRAKLIEGYSTYTSVYHAWNEVYIDEEWLIIDTTIDAQLSNMNMDYDIEKTDETHSRVKSF
jgi:transglutaminase-like putative cysteine protease